MLFTKNWFGRLKIPKDPSVLKIVQHSKSWCFTYRRNCFTICAVFLPLFLRKKISTSQTCPQRFAIAEANSCPVVNSLAVVILVREGFLDLFFQRAPKGPIQLGPIEKRTQVEFVF